jgi:hypothetical protein
VLRQQLEQGSVALGIIVYAPLGYDPPLLVH